MPFYSTSRLKVLSLTPNHYVLCIFTDLLRQPEASVVYLSDFPVFFKVKKIQLGSRAKEMKSA